MEKLALSIPGYGQIANTPMDTSKFVGAGGQGTIANTITVFAEPALLIGAFLMFFWAAWGVFDYIKAEGNKDALSKARRKIQWAIAGFFILVLAFFLSDTIRGILQPQAVDLTPLTK